MKTRSIAELRVFRWLAVLLVLLITIPIVWQKVSMQRTERQEAAKDETRILSALEDGRHEKAWVWSRGFLQNPVVDAESLRDVGQAFLEAGRPNEAFLLLEESETRDSSAETLHLLAKASLARGMAFDAVSFAERAVSAGFGGREGQLLLGDCYRAARRNTDAIVAYSAVLIPYPVDRDALRGKAEAFQAIDRFEQAHSIWNLILNIPVKTETEAIRESRRHARIMRAYCLDGEGLPEKALVEWNSLLDDGRASADIAMQKGALLGLALHAFEGGDPIAAEGWYRALLPLCSGTERLEAQLGIVLSLQAQERDSDASGILHAVVSAHPDVVPVIYADERYASLRDYFLPEA